MYLFYTPQYTIKNINVHISVLNGALQGMDQVHSGICELAQLNSIPICSRSSPQIYK